MMESYLGVCMVVVVTALCICAICRIATHAILDEIESMRSKRFKKRVDTVAPYISKYIEAILNAMKNISMTEGAKANEEVKTTPRKRTVKKTEETE